jgi:hypothetical protein
MGTKPNSSNNKRIGIRLESNEQKQKWMDYCEANGTTLSELIRGAVAPIVEGNSSILVVNLEGTGQKERWLSVCKEKGTSLPDFVIESVEGHLNPPDDVKNTRELRKEIVKLNKVGAEFRNKLTEKELVIRQLRSDNETMQNRDFVSDSMGVKRLSTEMVNVIKNAERPVSETELIKSLGLDRNNVATLKGIANQLGYLQDLELIQNVNGRWRWVE